MAKLRVNPTASQAFLRGYSRSEAGILLLVRIWLWTPLIASALAQTYSASRIGSRIRVRETLFC